MSHGRKVPTVAPAQRIAVDVRERIVHWQIADDRCAFKKAARTERSKMKGEVDMLRRAKYPFVEGSDPSKNCRPHQGTVEFRVVRRQPTELPGARPEGYF